MLNDRTKKAASELVTVGAASLDTMAGGVPHFSIVWALLKSYIGPSAIRLRKERLEEILIYIKSNPDIFTQKALESPVFQDGMVEAIEEYMKIRSDIKRGVAKRIITGFTMSSDYEHFELEKLNMTLKHISVNSLKFIQYLNNFIVPKQNQQIANTLATIDFDNTSWTEETVFPYIKSQHLLSRAYDNFTQANRPRQEMLPHKPDPKHPTITSSMGVYIPVVNDIDPTDAIQELTMLGILWRKQFTTPTSNSDSTTIYHDNWSYTNFGEAFSSYILESGVE